MTETGLARLRRTMKTVARTAVRPKRTAYEWFARNAANPVFSESELRATGYVSQCGQDKWVTESLFPGRDNGVFVDIGANDGVEFSNTFILERDHNWTGLAVEPIPEVFEKLRRNRTCNVVNGCVGQHSGQQKFQVIRGYAQMLSGLVDEYDERHLKRIDHDIAARGGSRREISVTCYRLTDLLRTNGITSIDYLTIDVEGAELSILKTIDWQRIEIKVIGVENNYGDYRIPMYLVRRGYRLHSIVGDEFYVKSGRR
jgi:FkbM family methyltransferase